LGQVSLDQNPSRLKIGIHFPISTIQKMRAVLTAASNSLLRLQVKQLRSLAICHMTAPASAPFLEQELAVYAHLKRMSSFESKRASVVFHHFLFP
jgi:hypothetical protein